MHCLFIGHPRGGKSSLIKRLTGHPPTPNIPSTGVAEKVEVCTSTAVSSHSQWSALTLDDEAIVLMATANHAFIVEKAITKPAPFEHGDTDPDATPPTDDKAIIATHPTNNEATPSTDKALPHESHEAAPATGDKVTPAAPSS